MMNPKSVPVIQPRFNSPQRKKSRPDLNRFEENEIEFETIMQTSPTKSVVQVKNEGKEEYEKTLSLKIKAQKIQIDMLTKDLVNNEAKMESQGKEIERIKRISLLEVESLMN